MVLRRLGRVVAAAARIRQVGLSCAISMLGVALGAAQAPHALAADNAPKVAISDGAIVGIVKNGTWQFLGIPYAAPPVGKRRWQPPQPPASWAKPLQATSFGKTCPQSNEMVVFASPSVTEDCLYLNVFAPGSDAAKAHPGALPVMVWVHGGGFFDGESNDYDASKLVKEGNVIVVTLNYRLGILGFFAHPALDGEGHDFGDYGIMDQQFALKWVRHNIAAFGGDAGNVTIFGQSAGGTSVLLNLIAPASAGLFQHAIIESAPYLAVTPLSKAMSNGQGFAAAVGCVDQAAACLRSLSVEKILNAQPPYLSYGVIGDPVVPLQPGVAFASGKFNHVPVITGVVSDEQSFMVAMSEATGGPLTAANYEKSVAPFGAKSTAKILAAYPLKAYASPSLALVAVAEDYKACVARKIEQMLSVHDVPVYAYEFDDRTAPSYFPKVSFPMRAYHTSELQFLFPDYKGGQGTSHALDAAQQVLSREMIGYWTSFAYKGDPNATGAGLRSDWPRYRSDRDEILSLNIPKVCVSHDDGRQHNCGFWDAINGN
jgi:para-nitrobenzyl esterase